MKKNMGKKQLYILIHHFVGEGKTFTEFPKFKDILSFEP